MSHMRLCSCSDCFVLCIAQNGISRFSQKCGSYFDTIINWASLREKLALKHANSKGIEPTARTRSAQSVQRFFSLWKV